MKDKTYDKNERGLEVCQIAFRELVDKKIEAKKISKTAATKEAAKEADIPVSTAKYWYDPELAKRQAEKQAKRDAKKRTSKIVGRRFDQVQTPGNQASKSGQNFALLEQENEQLKAENAKLKSMNENLAKNLKIAIAYFKSGDSEQVDKLKTELKETKEREYQQGEILIKTFQKQYKELVSGLAEIGAAIKNITKKL